MVKDRMKIFFKTFGCRVNQVETQSMLEGVLRAGHSIAERIDEADACVVNTCAVTKEADRDSRRFIQSAHKKNPSCRLIATGCYATLYPEKIKLSVPDAVIAPNSSKSCVPSMISGALPQNKEVFYSRVGGFYGHTRAFVKVQDGCSKGCSYCVVPLARPVTSSKPLSIVKEEAGGLISKGFKEIALCGIRLGLYSCPQTGADLAGLLDALCSIGGEFRIRFSSLEASEISEKLIEAAVKAGDKFCMHFHLPLQSASDRVLADMGRQYDIEFYRGKMELVKSAFPKAGIYCDIIAGYPIETDADFRETAEFVDSAGFSGLHVFSYSKRAGTRAESLGVLAPEVVKARAQSLRTIDKKLRKNFAESLVGSRQKVLAEEFSEGAVCGLASNFQRVRIENCAGPLTGIVDVKITGSENGICRAVISGKR